jgi:hypothetical protein
LRVPYIFGHVCGKIHTLQIFSPTMGFSFHYLKASF